MKKEKCFDSFKMKVKGMGSTKYCGSQGPKDIDLPAGKYVIRFKASKATKGQRGKRPKTSKATNHKFSCSWNPIETTTTTPDPSSNAAKMLAKAKAAIENGVCYGDSTQCDCEGITKADSAYVEEVDSAKGVRLVAVNGIPYHDYEVGQEQPNPYTACPHEMYVRLPLSPVKGSNFTPNSLGTVGVALSGGFFFNERAAPPNSIALLLEGASFDTCQGHSTPSCQYHYHIFPTCIATDAPCEVLGYALDGFPIYGYCPSTTDPSRNLTSCYQLNDGEDGSLTTHYTFNQQALENGECDLDEANGIDFGDKRGYAYVFTNDFPYTSPGYFGTEVAQACYLEKGSEILPAARGGVRRV
ncbi:uncharacterized protein LOC143029011 [Oratosquilla oratoria]|uniref:uncharacterized protein LOC143029011 n=1 Tax=Oratosquilla oratoria TaxID=337810 RepID=UPI003F777396